MTASVPGWLRLLDGKRWFGGRGLSRKDVATVGVLCLLGGALVFILSLFVASHEAATALRVVGFLELWAAQGSCA